MNRTVHLSPIKLTKEQQDVIDFVDLGHNACIFGRAGVGKTTVVEEIRRKLTAKGIKVEVLSSSGISCTAYNGRAKTVHAHYGLQTAELPNSLLIERSLGRQNVLETISNTNVVIWDEISMSSERIFDLVNLLQHFVFKNNHPFGGIQMILVGDFWQLKPIPGPFDFGRLIYSSELFKRAFQHRFELTTIMRQSKEESKLRIALDQIRMGQCDNATEEYLQSLSKDRTPHCNSDEPPIHIFFKKLPVCVHNLNVLAELPGDIMLFESRDTGQAQCLENTVHKIINLKKGCKVMLTYNLNAQLKNGSQGKFIGLENDCLIVNFAQVGNVAISRRTWYKYDNNGTVKASRTQFPIVLSYAITVHKAQGLTLPNVVIHCSQEFVPGQTYVALSRVTQESSLQVIGFQRRFLLPPPSELKYLVTEENVVPHSDHTCCKNIVLEDTVFQTRNDDDFTDAREDHTLCNAVTEDFVAISREAFEANEGNPVILEDVLLCMSELSDELSQPPPTFQIESFLKKIVDDPVSHDPYSQSFQSAASYALENLDQFRLLSGILWYRIFVLFEDHLSENCDDMHITNKEFTWATTKIHQLFLTQEYRSDIVSAFCVRKWVQIDDGQRSLAASLLLHLYQVFVGKLVQLTREREESESADFNVREMDAEGRGKVRYVGGWAIKKCLDNYRRYVVGNRFSTSVAVRARLNVAMKKINLLENYVISQHDLLETSSRNPETLNAIEVRQYRERGLLHISDNTYEFFLALEQERVDRINMNMLVALKSNLVDAALNEMLNDVNLEGKFANIFQLTDDDDKVRV